MPRWQRSGQNDQVISPTGDTAFVGMDCKTKDPAQLMTGWYHEAYNARVENGGLATRKGCLAPGAFNYTSYGAGPHRIVIGAWRFVMAILPRGFDLGKLEVGTKETNAIEVGVTYIKALLDGKLMFEKDKINLIDNVLGIDYAAPIRSAIGI